MQSASRKTVGLLLVMLGVLFLLGTWSFAMAQDELDDDDGMEAVAAGFQKIKTISWQAKTTKKIKATDKNTGEEVKIKKNTSVVVVKRNYNIKIKNAASRCTYNGHVVMIPNKFLQYKKDLCTGKAGDYNTPSKEHFVNVTKSEVCRSKTNRLIWVSLDKQRVNVFKGAKGNWKLEKVFLTSTGKPNKPTPARVDVVNFKKMDYTIEGSHVTYFVEAVGSGFHKWSYSGAFKRRAGKQTISHGCIRLKPKDAKWMFKNIKEYTRVLIY